jgi:hypothetical protein
MNLSTISHWQKTIVRGKLGLYSQTLQFTPILLTQEDAPVIHPQDKIRGKILNRESIASPKASLTSLAFLMVEILLPYKLSSAAINDWNEVHPSYLFYTELNEISRPL